MGRGDWSVITIRVVIGYSSMERKGDSRMGNVTARHYSPRSHEKGGVEPDAEFTDEVIAFRLRLEHLHEFSGAGSSCYTTNTEIRQSRCPYGGLK